MQQGYGGPVWHASIASATLPTTVLDVYARRLLFLVGDASLGEWREERDTGTGLRVVHVRRRLTAAEAAVVGPVRDIRGTAEAERRFELAARRSGIHIGVLRSIET